jgi:hypothetical protein
MTQLPANAARLRPFPLNAGAPKGAGDLDLQIKILAATGWIDLEDGQHYEVHKDTLATRQITHRQRTVTSEFIEGSFAATSVRENVNEALVIKVTGDSYYEWRTYIAKLTDALEQLTYQVMVRIEDATEYWDCQPANYSIETQQEFIHARLGIVRATVPRLPDLLLVPASGDET